MRFRCGPCRICSYDFVANLWYLYSVFFKSTRASKFVSGVMHLIWIPHWFLHQLRMWVGWVVRDGFACFLCFYERKKTLYFGINISFFHQEQILGSFTFETKRNKLKLTMCFTVKFYIHIYIFTCITYLIYIYIEFTKVLEKRTHLHILCFLNLMYSITQLEVVAWETWIRTKIYLK